MPEPQYPGKTILEEKIEFLFKEIKQGARNTQSPENDGFLLEENQVLSEEVVVP